MATGVKIASVVALLVAAAARANGEAVEDHTARGLALMNAQKWDDSIGEFRKAVAARHLHTPAAWEEATNGLNALCHALRRAGFTPPQDIDKFYKWDEPPKPPPPPPPPPPIDPAFEGLKGTTWHWNNWRDVTFSCDGAFKAPTSDCDIPGRCFWWGEEDHLRIEWGDAGPHTAPKPGGDSDSWRTLAGHRTSDNEPFHAEWRKLEECPQDWYKVLGVEVTATAKTIKKAFRALSISLHPDKPGGDAAEFARVGSAYEVLSDPDQRALYDKSAGYAQDAKLYSEEASVVNSMDAQQFKAKDARATHIVDFYAPWCGHCQELAPQFRRAALAFDDNVADGEFRSVQFHAVNCDEQHSLCQHAGVNSYPSVRLYRPAEGYEEIYDGEHTPEALEAWVRSVQDSKIQQLSGRDFADKVRSQSHQVRNGALWLVDFSAGAWCGPCTSLKPSVRRIAEEMDGVANVGIVDCDAHRALCDEQGVTAYPELRYYTNDGPRTGKPIDTKYRVSHEIKLSLWAQGAKAGLEAGRAEAAKRISSRSDEL